MLLENDHFIGNTSKCLFARKTPSFKTLLKEEDKEWRRNIVSSTFLLLTSGTSQPRWSYLVHPSTPFLSPLALPNVIWYSETVTISLTFFGFKKKQIVRILLLSFIVLPYTYVKKCILKTALFSNFIYEPERLL